MIEILGQQGYFNSNPLFPEMPMSEEDPQHYSSTTSISPTTTEEETAMLSYASSQGSFYMQPGTTPGSNHQMQANYINEYSYYPQHGYSSGSDSHSSLMYASSPVNESPFVYTSHTYTAATKANSATPSPTSSMSSHKSLTNYNSITTAPGNMYLHPTQECIGYELTYSQRQEYSEGSSNFDNNSGGDDRKFFRNSSPVSSETRSSATMSNNISHSNHGRPKHSKSSKKNSYGKGQGRERTKKRCSNCHSVHSPSWRRSVDKKTKGALLCNACGL